MDRPYINSGILDLECVAKESWDDSVRLCEIAHELKYRKSARSVKLRQRVFERYFRLTGDPRFQGRSEESCRETHKDLERTFECKCEKKIRMKLPMGVVVVRCKVCRREWRVYLDGSGNLIIECIKARQSEREPPGHPKDGNERDPYEILGVSRQATCDQIKAAYWERAAEYHPDHVTNRGIKIREVAESEMKQINSAFENLRERHGC